MVDILYPPIEAIRRTLCGMDTPALDVFSATGLSPSWLQSVKEGRAKDPGYTRICTLIVWLNRHHGVELVNHIFAVTAEDK